MKIILKTTWQNYLINCHPDNLGIIVDALLTMKNVESDVLHNKYFVPEKSQNAPEIELVLDNKITSNEEEPYRIIPSNANGDIK